MPSDASLAPLLHARPSALLHSAALGVSPPLDNVLLEALDPLPLAWHLSIKVCCTEMTEQLSLAAPLPEPPTSFRRWVMILCGTEMTSP